MAQTIKLKRSATSGAVPTTGSLELGEVAINTYDGKMYIKKNDGTESVVEIGDTSEYLPLSGGTLTGDLTIAKGTTAKQAYHDLYIGGNALDGADSAIYIGNAGTGGGYGWELFYNGAGSANLNKLIIRSENLGNPVDALSFNQDGAATFGNTIAATGGNSTNWNTAYSWGDHAAAGYYPASNPNGYTSNVGDITDVVAGLGITGGSTSGSATISMDWAEYDAFTGTYPIVWKAENKPYSASWFTINGLTDTVTAPNFTATTSLRAPIFYDSGNTGNYLDSPTSSVFRLNGSSGFVLSANGSTIVTGNSGGIDVTGTVTATSGTITGALRVNGGSFSSGIDTSTVGIAIDRGDYIYSDDGSYLRRILGHTAGGAVEIGQGGTALINQINLLPGTAGNSAVKVNGNTVWNAGNDGSGSGLDADLLDGVHGSSFLRSDADDEKTGHLKLRNNAWLWTQYSPAHDEVRINANTAGGLDVYNQTDAGFAFIRAGAYNVGVTSISLNTSGAYAPAFFDSDNTANYLDSPTSSVFRLNGSTAVNLAVGGATKLTANSSGIDVTGTATMDGLTVDGVAQLGTISIYDNGTNATIAADSGHDLELRGRLGQNVNVYANGALNTTFSSTGIDVTGTGSFSSGININSNSVGLLIGGGTTGSTAIGVVKNSAGRLTVDTDGTRSLDLSTGGTKRLSADGSTGDISFYNNSGAAKLFWDASAEYLGLGTASPDTNLHVYHATRNGIALIESGDADVSLYLKDGNSTSISAVGIGATTDNLTLRAGNTERMRIDSAGNVGIGGAPAAVTHGPHLDLVGNRGTLTVGTGYFEDNGTTNFIGGARSLAFGAVGSGERMRIDSAGNVGIGTASPSAPLHVDAAGMGDVYSGLIQNSTTDTDHYNVVRFIQGALGSATGYIGTGGSATSNPAFRNSFVVGTQTAHSLVLATNDTERMRIDSAGAVTANNSFRAPIFYDSGNTGNYIDSPTSSVFRLNGSTAVNLAVGGSTKLVANSSGIDVTGTATMDGLDINSVFSTAYFRTSSTSTNYRLANGGDGSFSIVETNGLNYVGQRLHIADGGDISFYNNSGAAKFFWDASAESLGIGTSSPSTFNTSNGAGNLVVGSGSGSEGITVYSGTTSNGALCFADGTLSTDTYKGYVQYNHNTNSMQFATGHTERMRIDSAGAVTAYNSLRAPIFYDSDDTAFYVNPASTSNVKGFIFNSGTTLVQATPNIESLASNNTAGNVHYHATFCRNDGTVNGKITTNYYATTYSTTSDYRVKEDIQPMGSATADLMALNPINFQWVGSDIRTDGFLAHEVAAIVPDAVVGEKDSVDAKGNPDLQGLDQSKMVPLLVKTIQEQQAAIQALEARITALENA